MEEGEVRCRFLLFFFFNGWNYLSNFIYMFPVMRDLGTDARVDVEAQGVRVVTEGLLEDDLVPEMAEDGCPAG